MIDPLRYRPLKAQLQFDECDHQAVQCWQCQQERQISPAFFICHDCGKAESSRPFCEPCFLDYHTRKRGKENHKPHPIVRGDPVIVQTLAEGDGKTYAKMHDWVALHYTLKTDISDADVIEDTFASKQPLIFQSGCSGPCVHLQLLGCSNIAAADILGSSDPYCAVYWKNELVGVTSTKHMTLDPAWANQTFVLPLSEDFVSAFKDDNPSALFNVGSSLSKLRIEVYDWDRLSKNDFLGQASVSDADILGILRHGRTGEAEENEVVPFKLCPKQSRGRLGIRLALKGKKLFIHVVKGENLPNADPHSLSDPYCELYWNGIKAGTTARIDDTPDPEWDLEIFVIKVDAEGPNSVEESTLRIECLDWDQFGSNDVLGQIELEGRQIKELVEQTAAEGVDGVGTERVDGPSGEDGGALPEADVEAIYDFVQKFQQQEEQEGGAGGMVVGVPREEHRRKNRQKRPQNSGKDIDGEGKEGAGWDSECRDEEKPAPAELLDEEKGSEGIEDGSLADETSFPRQEGGGKSGLHHDGTENRRTELPEGKELVPDDRPAAGDEIMPLGEKAPEGTEVVEAAEAGVDEIESAEGDSVSPPGEQPPSSSSNDGMGKETVVSNTSEANAVSESTFISTEKPELATGRGAESLPLLQEDENVDVSQTIADGRLTASDEEGKKYFVSECLDSVGVMDFAEIAAPAEGKPDTHRAEVGKRQSTGPESVLIGPAAEEVVAGRSVSGLDDVYGEATGNNGMIAKADEKVEKDEIMTPVANGAVGGEDVLAMANETGRPSVKPRIRQSERSAASDRSTAPSPGPREKKKDAAGPTRHREAHVQKFEEERGVLVQYTDDDNTEWIATRLIPTLEIREAQPVPRTFLQTLWDKRNAFVHLHKNVLNVRRGLKMLLNLAMMGSRMQWYSLGLTGEQSGATFIRGTVNARFLFHNRGSVLRGLDVAVSHMSLGERARIEVRSDYGFGEIYAERRVPPYSTLVFIAQIVTIGHHDATSILLRRAFRDALEDRLFLLRTRMSKIASYFACLAAFKGRTMGLLPARKQSRDGWGERDVETEWTPSAQQETA